MTVFDDIDARKAAKKKAADDQATADKTAADAAAVTAKADAEKEVRRIAREVLDEEFPPEPPKPAK